MTDQAAAPPPPDPLAALRTKSYVQLLVLAALVGIPVSAVAYGFLKLVSVLQHWFFQSLPGELGFHGLPVWWPLPLLGIAGILVALSITYLPGTSGHQPAEGFQAGTAPTAAEFPGVFFAALATLSFGVVLGPEAPLIAIGGCLGALAVKLAAKDAPPTAATVMAAAGSFAAVSTLLGSPIVGAFLMMEVSGIGGPMLGMILVPGLLAAGVGTLVFVGLNNLTGFGTFSLAIPGIPSFSHPTLGLIGWGIVIGLVCPFIGTGVRLSSLALQDVVNKKRLVLTPVVGLVVAAIAIIYSQITGHPISDVLFSGQSQLPSLVLHPSGYTVAALVFLLVCKALAYSFSLSSFRGGPIFPSMFIGGALGIAMAHLPGMSLVPGVAMGIGAMVTVMLKLPMTATLLATLLLSSDALALAPLVIVAVVVSYVLTAWMPQKPSDLSAALHKTSVASG